MTTMQESIIHSDPTLMLELLESDISVQGELCEVLAGFPMFDNLSVEELRLVIPYLQVYRATAGTAIVAQGSLDNRLGIVLEGQVTVCKEDDAGAQQSLKALTTGMWFGESSWVDNSPAWATVIAVTDARLVLLSREDFFKLAGKHAIIGVRMIHKVCRLLSLQLSQVRGQCVEYLG